MVALAKMVTGAGWTIATGIGSRILSLVGTLVLTHFLALEVQGEVSNAYIIVATAHWATCSLPPYLTARPNSGPEIAWNILVCHLLLGALALGGAVAVAMGAGPFLKAPGMAHYAPGFAASFFLVRLTQVPERLVTRNLDFRTIGMVRGFSETAYGVGAVAFAAMGFGGMSIVYGNVARGLVSLCILLPRVPAKEWLVPTAVRWSIMKPVVSFAYPLSASGFITAFTRRWDNLFLSSRFGAAVAGAYNSAYSLADVPALQVGEQIGDVLLPSLARMTQEERKQAVVKSAGLLSLIIFPLAIGLGAVADSVVKTLLARSYWDLVSPMLAILACTSVTRPLSATIVIPYLEASGRTRPIMGLAVAELILLVGCLFTFGRPSWQWACYAVALTFILHALVSLWLLQLFDGVRMWLFLRQFGPVLLACVPMVLAVLAVRHACKVAGMEIYAVRLALEVLAGAVTYVASAFIIARSLTRELIDIVREIMARRRNPSGSHAALESASE